MKSGDDELHVRPGRIRSRGGAPKPQAFTVQILKAAQKAGHVGPKLGSRSARSTFGRGRSVRLGASLGSSSRRVVVKARVVRHRGVRFRSAPLSTHLSYLKRDGVTREGGRGVMFDARSDTADEGGFAERCEGDRHHFRFIVSPEDAHELADLKAYTRDLMTDAERDLGTRLEWVAVAHHNTDNPHVHVLVRGRAEDGSDLVISRDYIGRGLRERAEELVGIELGPKSEVTIRSALGREVGAERWTRLDQALRREADQAGGMLDLRPGLHATEDPELRRLMVGRAQHLERMGFAHSAGTGRWSLSPDAEPVLRDMAARGDVIRTMHQAMSKAGFERAAESYTVHDDRGPATPARIVGRVMDRGLADELKGSAYLVVDGVDGRVHHVGLPDLAELERAPRPGGVVKLRSGPDGSGHMRTSVRTLSDLSLDKQATAQGATWLDRELVSREKTALADTGFGAEAREALAARTEHLVGDGLARRQAMRVVFANDLLNTLRERELANVASTIAKQTGLSRHRPQEGERVAGVYTRRLDLASGRVAVVEDATGGRQFVLVPWRPEMERQLGREVAGVMRAEGGIDWSGGRNRGPSI